ncbi:MAG: tRNA(Ile)-lysidine synthase [Chlamydiae bacterium]|nr:tRNA(Ile)-lysidine synthase [Chlamydiota bacterium]
MTSSSIERAVILFLEKHSQGTLPFLLGFSGGEDSLALAHCLRCLGVSFHIAHYDHGWRVGSADEANRLEQMATDWSIPFHTKRSPFGNRGELQAREERHSFFEELYQAGNFQALFLAHHREDQVETLLKRVLEGAHLTTLKGILPVTRLGTYPVWRPLLAVPKKTILSYIEENCLLPIDDETNRNPKYLRSRMRTHLLPAISKHFGKEIAPSLLRLSQYAQELDTYLEETTQDYWKTQKRGPFGIHWDLTPFVPFKRVLLRYVLKRFFEGKGGCPSAFVIDQIVDALEEGAANRKVAFGMNILFVDRGHLFFLERPLPTFSEKLEIGTSLVIGEWRWTIRQEEEGGSALTGWRSWWMGTVTLSLPKGEYQLLPPARGPKKKWSNNKIPAFLRSSLPVIGQGGKFVGEFLIGDPITKKTETDRQVLKVEVRHISKIKIPKLLSPFL